MCYNFEQDSLGTRPMPQRCSGLFRSANNGCYRCQILQRVIESFCRVENQYETEFAFFVKCERNGEDELRKCLEFKVWDVGKPHGIGIELYRTADGPCPWGLLEVKLNLPKGTASPASYSWVQDQMKRCLDQHPQCGTYSDFPILPTRVLDLGSHTASANNSIRVLETNGLRGKYCALSHCWGNPELMPTKLTAHTLKEYQDNIPYDSLPRTFRDAVTFAKTMGIRYLWIDSLCIIQRDNKKDAPDDQELADKDWTRESGMMCSVFENSYLTLAAASSHGCTGGLFFSPKTVKIRGTNTDGPYQIYARERPNHNAGEFPLLKRGWVMQESLLAPRTLFFGESELIWLCRGHRACQCSTSAKWALAQFPEWYIKLPNVNQLNDCSVHLTYIKMWYKIVENYSTTSLTHQTDKLTAIDGIVQYMRRLRNCDYRAGLWSDSLALDLLWHTVIQNGRPSRRTQRNLSEETPWSSDKWLFPTWSWASIHGEIYWSTDEDIIENCPVEAILVNVIEECPANAEDYSSACPAYELKLCGVVVPSSVGALQEFREAGGVYYPDWDDQLNHLAPDTKVACLRILGKDHEYYSLVLLRVDEDKSIYERIGLLYFKDVLYKWHPNSDIEWQRKSEIKGFPSWWEVSKSWEPEEVTVTLT
ncbi:HET-domain-containing protein [Hypoxylon sp. FL1857]|nr:HET-domain-containing protein [Hypoxylon sp. FL1857]